MRFFGTLQISMATYRGPAFDGFMSKIHQAQGSSFGGITLERFFKSLQRLLEKKAHIFWNHKYFLRNIEDKIIPWGLRIQIFPNIFKIESDFKKDWESNLQSCSVKIMEALCQNYVEDLEVVNNEIEKL